MTATLEFGRFDRQPSQRLELPVEVAQALATKMAKAFLDRPDVEPDTFTARKKVMGRGYFVRVIGGKTDEQL